jgi:uncharacterized protein YbcI
MTAVSAVLRGGELNAAITSAIVRIHNAQLGRGPRTATTFHKDNVIVTLMYDVMTQAEKTLAEHDNDDAVTHMRHLFQKTMQTEFTDAVERLTGRNVIAFISGNTTKPDVASELFILDSSLYPTTPESRAATTDPQDT